MELYNNLVRNLNKYEHSSKKICMYIQRRQFQQLIKINLLENYAKKDFFHFADIIPND